MRNFVYSYASDARKLTASAVVALVMLCSAGAQDMSLLEARKAMNKYAKKELTVKASKAARKAAKSYARDGWEVAPGHLPLEKQLDRAYSMQYEFDESGYPLYLMSEAMSVGGSYDAAKLQAMELSKLQLAGQISSEIIGIIENTVGNDQLSQDEAASVVETISASKNVISQRLGRVITVVECYRTLPNKNKEVRVQIAYNSKMAMENAKSVVKEELEKKGEKLHERLDSLLKLN